MKTDIRMGTVRKDITVKDLTQNTHKWLLDSPQTAKMSKAMFSLVHITSVTYGQWPHYVNGGLYEHWPFVCD